MGRGEHEDERHDLEGERGAHAGQQRACDAAGGGDGVGHAPEVVGHEYNSGGMRGEPAARDAHGDAHVRRRQRRPVVDPVPDHTHHAPPAELADRLELGGGLHAGSSRVDADRRAHRLRLGLAVAREHDRLHAQRTQRCHRHRRLGPHRIRKLARRDNLAPHQHPQHRGSGAAPCQRRRVVKAEAGAPEARSRGGGGAPCQRAQSRSATFGGVLHLARRCRFGRRLSLCRGNGVFQPGGRLLAGAPRRALHASRHLQLHRIVRGGRRLQGFAARSAEADSAGPGLLVLRHHAPGERFRTHVHAETVDNACDALAFQELEPFHLAPFKFQAVPVGVLQKGGGDRVGRERFERSGQAEHRVQRLLAGIAEHHLVEPEAALGQRARLVQRQRAHPRQQLHLLATLDQHTPPRHAGDPTRVRDRHGNDERAGARQNRQRDGAAQPPVALRRRGAAAACFGRSGGHAAAAAVIAAAAIAAVPPTPTKRHSGEEESHEQNKQGVYLGEALEEQLARRRTMRLRDERAQLRGHAFRRQPLYPHPQHARLVDGARRDAVALALQHGH
mmetsp:Transcript_32292/g.104311  ORF Transcript_32292/g.104311 Transcript_32292/m.104311 type:complete len:559 (+) Transcript_32292:300-1976(+)